MLTSLSGLAFFGLTSDSAAEFKIGVYSMIHEIVFNGQGGYSWTDVYQMPLWLRKFTFNKLKDHYEKQNKKQDLQQVGNQQVKTLVDSSGQVNKAEFNSAAKPYTKSTYK